MEEKRIKERQIVKPALKIVKEHPGINTTQLMRKLENIVQLYPGDKEILSGRNDTKFSQIVRNLISHIETNKFGKCVRLETEGKISKIYLNEVGIREIEGYIKKEIKEEQEDAKMQKKIRESDPYLKNELKEANTRQPERKSKSSYSKYKTDARIARTVLEENHFICEIERLTGKTHKTFQTSDTNQYMEGHHLIPMKMQKDFNLNIDRSSNICCLCPNCHKALHYGTIEVKKNILSILYKEKKKQLKSDGIEIELEDLINQYWL